jgi:steroid delta-isomerase-like uncharacterized protein
VNAYGWISASAMPCFFSQASKNGAGIGDMDKALEATVNRHLAAENEHRMQETLAELHPDCLFEDIPLEKVYRGLAEVESYYRAWWDAFDLKVEGERRHWSEDGTFMIAETWYHGVHRGPFLDHPPTGRRIDFRLAVIIPFRDGLMAGERFYYDLATLLRQIGALPGSETEPCA